MVIEVLSPSSRGHNSVRKMALDATAGVEEYWIADPDHEELAIYPLIAGEYQRRESSDGSARSHVLHGLVVDVGRVFGRTSSRARTHTRLLWNVLWPARSPRESDVVQLTLRPSGERLAQRPFGATATPR